jgi:glycosyltransferase involved in cell wall biosynthesis
MRDKGQVEVAGMKILHILNTSKLSGAENVVADICMMFQNKYQMAYCSPAGPIEEALTDRGVSFFPVNKLNFSSVRRVLRKYKPDIIHAHDPKATLLAAALAGSKPLVSHLHGNNDNMAKITVKSILYMLAARRVDRIIVVAESCLDEYILKSVIERKTVLLRNIIFSKRIEKLIDKDENEYKFDFIFLGSLIYPKHPDRVARVASEVLKRVPAARFGIIGEGELAEQMEKIFITEGVSDRAVFTGRLPYPYKALSRARCFLMCSRNEGTPIAALEAMAFGLPIVSTPVDGIVKLVENGKTGFLSDDESVLADALIILLTDDVERMRMSQETLRKFKEINNQKAYYLSLESIYQSLYDKQGEKCWSRKLQ